MKQFFVLCLFCAVFILIPAVSGMGQDSEFAENETVQYMSTEYIPEFVLDTAGEVPQSPARTVLSRIPGDNVTIPVHESVVESGSPALSASPASSLSDRRTEHNPSASSPAGRRAEYNPAASSPPNKRDYKHSAFPPDGRRSDYKPSASPPADRCAGYNPSAKQHDRSFTPEAGPRVRQDSSPAPQMNIVPGMPDPRREGMYRVQIGAFSNEAFARSCFERLQSAGLNPVYELYGSIYRIVIPGVISSNIPSLIRQLETAHFTEVWIREEK